MNGLKIAKLFGIEIRIHPSWLFIFLLITSSLATGVFPLWHPEWNSALAWSMSIVAAALFFVSLLAHELAHSLVGRRQGMGVDSITLFMLGGVANLSEEPKSPKSEFWMTIVGPLTSLFIGIISGILAFSLDGSTSADYTHALDGVSALGTIMIWLSSINIILAIFNMIPAYPLDGGRILHAIVWKITGKKLLATRLASLLGRGFASLLIFMGVLMIFGFNVPYFGTGLVGGLWLVFIGFFVNQAANATYLQQKYLAFLEHIPVSKIMRSPTHVVDADLDIEHMLYAHKTELSHPAIVVKNDHVLGVVHLKNVRQIPAEKWHDTPVQKVMTPLQKSVKPTDSLDMALKILSTERLESVPVLQEGKLVGVVLAKDIENIILAKG